MSFSVVFLTFNSEKNIRPSIEAALRVSDDIHAVDSGSTDKTIDILLENGVKVTKHPFEHYGAQRNWAIENLPLKYTWELHLDADEVLTENLICELNHLKQSLPTDIDGYFIPRQPSFLGRKIFHGAMFPIWHMRLFRHGKGRCEDRKYDQHFFVNGKTSQLRGVMLDHVCDNLSEWVIKHNRWAESEVDELLSTNTSGRIAPNLQGNPVEQKRFWRKIYNGLPLFVRPFLLFFYRYFLRLGFLDGVEGFIFFILKDFWFRFLVDAKMFERINKNNKIMH
ncbi:MAG: glycosyltransferase family 2 protein [Candidatus Riflebacteria bacterium]|nr:glycosyltransferase family 2 protein [Candidatus Riflebacteria bacterium]